MSDLLELEPCRFGAARSGFHTRVLKGSGFETVRMVSAQSPGTSERKVRTNGKCDGFEEVASESVGGLL